MFGAPQNRTLRQRPTTNGKPAVLVKADKVPTLLAKTGKAKVARAALGDLSNAHGLVDEKKKAVKKAITKTATIATKTTVKTRVLVEKTEKTLAKDTTVKKEVKEDVVRVEVKSGIPKKKVVKAVAPSTRKTRSSDVHKSIEVSESSSDQLEVKRKTKVIEPVLVDKRKVEDVVMVVKKARVIEHDDLDCDDLNDPMMVSEYVEEIFEYLRQLEKDTMPNANYMDNQKELQWKMRSILVDWLIEVHTKFRLLPETLYLTVNIIDRFLSNRVVSLVKLQLVGITALFIASKYEEVISPSLSSFLYMAEDGYSEDEIIKAERYVLQVLKFNMQYPTPMSFLRRSSKADDYDIQTRTLAKYLMEVTLLDHRFLAVPASAVAAAGHYLARHMLERGEWTQNLIYYSGYTEQELAEPTALLLEFLSKPCKFEAIYKKYSQRKFMKGSVFVREWVGDHRGFLHPSVDHKMNDGNDGEESEVGEVESEKEEREQCSEEEQESSEEEY